MQPTAIVRLMKLSTKLSGLAKTQGLKPAEIARRTGVSHTAAGKWLKGDAVPGLYEAAALARALNVPIAYLADDSLDEVPIPDDDEAQVLNVIRDLGLSRREAIRRLASGGPIEPATQIGDEIPVQVVRNVVNPRQAEHERRNARAAAKKSVKPKGPDALGEDEGPDGDVVPAGVRR